MRRARKLPLEELRPFLIDIQPGAAFAKNAADTGPPAFLANAATANAAPENTNAATRDVHLDLRGIFGNDHPVELEIGFGKGMFLIGAAQAHPERNYLGIEIERAYQLYVANRLAKRKLTNVRLACGDARLLLGCFADRCLRALHIYFPDPWWKRRHRKRRLFTEAFAAQCARLLQPGGCLHVLSDVPEYFAEIQKVLGACLQALPSPEPGEPRDDLDYLTNFERKYRKQSRPIYRACYWNASGRNTPLL